MNTTKLAAWRPVPGFSNYLISDDGRIKNTKTGRTLNPAMCGGRKRYPSVTLSQNGRQFSGRVHQLVLMAFVGPCPPGMEAMHLNDIATDNRLENLKWGSHAENMAMSEVCKYPTKQRKSVSRNRLNFPPSTPTSKAA